MRSVILTLAVILLAGCGRSIHTPFQGDPRKSPLGQTCYCNSDGSASTDGGPVTIPIKGHIGEHDVAEGGGCVLRPLAETWSVTRTAAAVTWAKSSVTRFDQVSSPHVDFLFRAGYEAGPRIFRQKWEMEWYHTVLEGTASAPKRVVINYKKVNGTGYISYWQGSIELKEMRPHVTSVLMRNEVSAAQTGPDDVAQGIRDMVAHLRTLPAGR